MSKIGIIGGTGTYNIKLENESTIEVNTPFGPPSDVITLGEMSGKEIAFLPRHGRYHQLLPHEINYRANIYALKAQGVDTLISICTAGSLNEALEPGMIVIPDQIIDWTKQRPSTFFGNGIGAYVDLSEPFCPVLSRDILEIITKMGMNVHYGGTYICIEGPQFSTNAESELFANIGGDIIGMTAQPEAKLAREAEMCYTTIAGISDYNICGMPSSMEDSMKNMHQLIRDMKKIISNLMIDLPQENKDQCACSHTLKRAIITSRKGIPQETLDKLSAILGKYNLEKHVDTPHGTVLE